MRIADSALTVYDAQMGICGLRADREVLVVEAQVSIPIAAKCAIGEHDRVAARGRVQGGLDGREVSAAVGRDDVRLGGGH